jgi:hypothetical protein
LVIIVIFPPPDLYLFHCLFFHHLLLPLSSISWQCLSNKSENVRNLSLENVILFYSIWVWGSCTFMFSFFSVFSIGLCYHSTSIIPSPFFCFLPHTFSVFSAMGPSM